MHDPSLSSRPDPRKVADPGWTAPRSMSRPYEYPATLQVTKGTPRVPDLRGTTLNQSAVPKLLGIPTSTGTSTVEMVLGERIAGSPFKAILNIKARR